MKKCSNCLYARMACCEGKIACGRIFTDEHYKNNYSRVFDELDLSTLTIGWAFMKRRPNSVSGGTVDEGLMTNNVILFDERFSCKYWKEL